MTKISAVILTKNEEKNIERCLASLDGIADEIIVVDALSTDRTEEICRARGVTFVQKQFVDYSASKNFGNSLSRHPYVLSLDADEEISTELKDSILHIKPDLQEDGYCFNRKTNYCGKWISYCGWYPDTKVRLFRKSAAHWKGRVHETLEIAGGRTKLLQGDLLHYSFPSINQHARKINVYAEMKARELFEGNVSVSTLKLVVAPMFEFFKKYLLQRGFLDGYYGFVISTMSSYYTFYKYAKLKEMWLKQTPGQS